MLRVAVVISALTVVPSLAAAQQPCTTDSRQVVEQIYRQVLERSADAGPSTVGLVASCSRRTGQRQRCPCDEQQGSSGSHRTKVAST